MPKDKETTTFGASSKKLARLLAVGFEQGSAEGILDDTQKMAEVLRDHLREPMPITSGGVPDRRTREGNVRYTIEALSGEPIGKLLSDPRTDIALIRRIKDYARRLSTSAKSKPEHHAANTLYYAAIASALVHHSTRITTHSYTDLKKSLTRLTDEHWVPEALTELFVGAKWAAEHPQLPRRNSSGS
jgi:hypothetical protein